MLGKTVGLRPLGIHFQTHEGQEGTINTNLAKPDSAWSTQLPSLMKWWLHRWWTALTLVRPLTVSYSTHLEAEFLFAPGLMFLWTPSSPCFTSLLCSDIYPTKLEISRTFLLDTSWGQMNRYCCLLCPQYFICGLRSEITVSFVPSLHSNLF